MIAAAHVDAAHRLIAAAARRAEVFAGACDGFGDPGWQMLLTLFATGGAPVDRTTLLAASGAEAAIAERYAEWLASKQLAVTDDGVMRLAPLGEQLLERYFTAERGAEDAGAETAG